MLTFITSLKLITEVALLSLAGQWVLGLLVGERRESSLMYQLLQRIGSPFVFLAARVCPKRMLQRHHPWVAFLLLALVWSGLTAFKVVHCLEIGVQLCR